MIHCFESGSERFLLDVESGAVHMVDEPAQKAALLWESTGYDAARNKLIELYPTDEVDEVLGELSSLKEAGELFCPEQVEVTNFSGVVKAMCLHIAHDCNLRCKYCFAETGEYHGGRALMSFDTGKAALDFLVNKSGDRTNLEVDFFGGEPLMNFEVVKRLVAYGRELEKLHGKVIRFTITTNCVGVDDEFVEFADKELSNVVLSIDGRKEIHDALRVTPKGGGSFDIAFPKAKKIAFSRQEKGLDYYVRGTFTRNNIDFSKDVEFLADEGIEQISIEPVVLPESDPVSLREADMPAIMDEYDKLLEMVYERRKDGRWMNFFHFMVDLAHGPCLAKRMTGCGAGSEYVAVTPQGDIYPCHQFVGNPAFKMGSVFTGEFDEAIQERFARNTISSKPACRNCWAKYFCSGGCAANANEYGGDIKTPYAPACNMERKRVECAIALYAREHFND